MSRDPVTELRASYEAMSRQDWSAALRGVHPDFELKTPGEGLDADRIQGVENAQRAFEEFFNPYDAVSVAPEEFFEGEDQVVVFFLQRARPAGSTAFLERRAAHLWTMRDGKPAKLEIFPEREKALEAAGLGIQCPG